MNERKPLPQALRQKILDRDIICVYCGDTATVVDHVVPYSWSNCDDEDNLVGACLICNSLAHDMVFTDFDKKRAFIKREREKRKIDDQAFCIECHTAFKPRVHGATAFICAKCNTGKIILSISKTDPEPTKIRRSNHVRTVLGIWKYPSTDAQTNEIENTPVARQEPKLEKSPETLQGGSRELMKAAVGLKVKPAASTPGISQLNVRDMLAELIKLYGHDPNLIAVDDLQTIANKLSIMSGKKPGEEWGWRYLRNILNKKLEASKQLTSAIMALGAVADGVSPLLAGSHPVQVMARLDVAPGSVILAASRSCANPRCPIVFVPVVPRQRFCCADCRKSHKA